MSEIPTFKSFDDFWPHYVREHSKRKTRAWHAAGTGLAIASLIYAYVQGEPAFVVLAAVLGYGPAWVSHFAIEGNRPATFRYPLWSLIADLRMFGLTLTGQMDEEVARALETDR